MRRRVRENISGAEVVPNVTSTIFQVRSSGELVYLSSGIRSSSKLCPHMKRAGGPTAHILYIQSSHRCENQIPED
ncbi:hypothetical protein ACFX2A_035174 [Malus domestica]